MEFKLSEAQIKRHSKKSLLKMVEHMYNWNYYINIDQVEEYVRCINGVLISGLDLKKELYNNLIERRIFILNKKEELIKKYIIFIDQLRDRYKDNLRVIKDLQDTKKVSNDDMKKILESKITSIFYENKRIHNMIRISVI